MFTALIAYLTPLRLAGRLSTQSLLFALGERHVPGRLGGVLHRGRRPPGPQVGLGLTSLRSRLLIAACPMGKLVDHFGPKRCGPSAPPAGRAVCWRGPSSTASPVRRPRGGAWRSSGRWAARPTAPISSTSSLAAERVESRAYMYSALNVGFSLGASSAPAPSPSAPTRSAGLPRLSAVLFLAHSAVNPPAARRLPRRPQQRAASQARGHPRDPQPRLDRGDLSSRESCGPTRCCCTRSSRSGW